MRRNAGRVLLIISMGFIVAPVSAGSVEARVNCTMATDGGTVCCGMKGCCWWNAKDELIGGAGARGAPQSSLEAVRSECSLGFAEFQKTRSAVLEQARQLEGQRKKP